MSKKKISKKFKIEKRMTFAEILQKEPCAGYFLAEKGLFCGGCAMAQFETLEQGARAHGINPQKLVNDLNKKFGDKTKSKKKKK
jgi:hybrid cluster-associated redox disulfide protein